MKKVAKYSLFIFLLFAVVIAGSFIYFLVKNDAPILHGEIECSLEYKKGLNLDIYLPTKNVFDKIPVVIYFHGGAWIVGSKISVNNARFNQAFNELREKGYAVVSPEYTLGEFGKTPFPHCITDAFDAVAWVEKNAATYNFDKNNIGLLGESAGGHLALMAAFADGGIFNSKYEMPLSYVVSVYAPFDLHSLYHDQSFLLDSIKSATVSLPATLQERLNPNKYLFGFDPEQDTIQKHVFTEKYSPINYVSNKSFPILIIHGESDQIVPISQSESLMGKLQQHKISFEYHFLKDVDHGFRGATEEQKKDVQKWIVDFVEKYYNSTR